MEKYINKYEVIIKVIDKDEKTVSYRIGKGTFWNYRCIEKNSFYNMLRINEYKKVGE